MTVLHVTVMRSFRSCFKSAFRWLPCVTWQRNDDDEQTLVADVCAGELPMSESGYVHSNPPPYSDVVEGSKRQPIDS
jgi:hypothetical protein